MRGQNLFFSGNDAIFKNFRGGGIMKLSLSVVWFSPSPGNARLFALTGHVDK